VSFFIAPPIYPRDLDSPVAGVATTDGGSYLAGKLAERLHAIRANETMPLGLLGLRAERAALCAETRRAVFLPLGFFCGTVGEPQ
jgi:hypothetical protein